MMALKAVTEGLSILPGMVNMYLLDAPEGLTLIDAGFPGDEKKVLDALEVLGRPASDLKHIVLTHAHPDHIGGLAALKQATGARTYMHPTDIPIAERGGPSRPMTAAPGLLSTLVFKLFVRPSRTVAPVRIDQAIADGEVLPIAGGLEVIHVPGHCAGQVALVWTERGVLFTGDACANMLGLGEPVGYEDRAQGQRSQRKLAGLDCDVACFGHGKPIVGGASARLREAFG